MPKLTHVTACKQCPYRRDSLPGWLGSGTPESFAYGAVADKLPEEFPCHCAIDYDDPKWKDTQYPEASLCAGALAMARNNCKLATDPERAALIAQVPRDPEVFQFPAEFLAHHKAQNAKVMGGLAHIMDTGAWEPWMMTEEELEDAFCECDCPATMHYDYADECDCGDCDKFRLA